MSEEMKCTADFVNVLRQETPCCLADCISTCKYVLENKFTRLLGTEGIRVPNYLDECSERTAGDVVVKVTVLCFCAQIISCRKIVYS